MLKFKIKSPCETAPSYGRVIRQDKITRTDLRCNRNILYVFGDNCEKRGFGGQAAEMRGEPNAVGIVTKWKPERTRSAYFTDSSFQHIRSIIDASFIRIETHLRNGKDVIIPSAGVGTGLAELDKRASRIFAYIEDKIAKLEKLGKESDNTRETGNTTDT